MALSVFWDAAFNIRSLRPRFVSPDGQASPITIPTGTTVQLQVQDSPGQNPISIRLNNGLLTQTSCKVSIAVSTTPVVAGGPTTAIPETGVIVVDLAKGEYELPTEGLTFLLVQSLESSDSLVGFVFNCQG